MTLRAPLPISLNLRLLKGRSADVLRVCSTEEQARLEGAEEMALHRFRRDVSGKIMLTEYKGAAVAVCSLCGCHSAPVECDTERHASTTGFCA